MKLKLLIYVLLKPFEDQIIQLSYNNVSLPKLGVERNWEDSSKIVNYMELILNRIKKYCKNFVICSFIVKITLGLEYPTITNVMDSETANKKVSELTDRFVREMRKPPKVEVNSGNEEEE